MAINQEKATEISGYSAQEAAARNKEAGAAFAELTKEIRPGLRVGMAVMAVSAVLTITPYIALAILAGKSLTGNLTRDIGWALFVVIVSSTIISAILKMVALGITHKIDAQFSATLKERIVDTIAKAPLSWFSERSSGQIRKALENDVGAMHYMVAHAQVETLAGVVTPLTALTVSFIIDWRLALISIIPFLVYMLFYVRMSSGQGQMMLHLENSLAKMSSEMTELVNGITVIKTFGRTGKAHAQYRQAADHTAKFFSDWSEPMIRFSAIMSLLLALPFLLTYQIGIGAFMTFKGWATLSDTITVALLSGIVPWAVLTVGNAMQARMQSIEAALRVKNTLETPPLPVSDNPQTPADNSITFRNVDYSYEPGEEVLHDISLQVPAGSSLALVGASGSGKSTLATLVPRFDDPDAGTISIGGVDIRDIDPKTLYQHVGFILQNVAVLNISVRENIRLGCPDADEETVIAAAKAAQIHDVISQLPAGYDTILGDKVSLSGGEKQRISIARAIIANPPILILDEATSFADPEAEADIQQALLNLLTGRTLVIIAHRLETIKDADQIAVLDGGKLAEKGTHAELLAASGVYAHLWDSHQGASS